MAKPKTTVTLKDIPKIASRLWNVSYTKSCNRSRDCYHDPAPISGDTIPTQRHTSPDNDLLKQESCRVAVSQALWYINTVIPMKLVEQFQGYQNEWVLIE